MSELKVLNLVNKKYGAGTAFLLGESQALDVPVIPTGSLKLDDALGVGGIPRGRITEIFGPEQSGKSTLCQHIAANCQAIGGRAVFIDVENAVDMYWAEVCGVNTNDLIVSQPESGELALSLVEDYANSGEIDLIIVDSVAALTPRAEIEGEVGDAHMALTARLMSQAMRRLSSVVKVSDVVLIFTNQMRSNIGVMFGPKEVTTGGVALRYYASVRIDLKRGKQIKEKDEIVGTIIRAQVRKNKVAPPFRLCEPELYFDEGFSLLSDLIFYGLEIGTIEKGGAWFTIGEEKVHGERKLRELLRTNSDLFMQLEDEVRQHLRLPIRRNDAI